MDIEEKIGFYVKFKEETTILNTIILKNYNIIIGKGSKIGKGTIIMRNVVIKEDVLIKDNCVIGNNSLLRENVWLEEGVKIGFSTVIEPNAKIGTGTNIHGLCVISEFSKIGRNCFLGPHFNTTGDPSIGKPKGEYKPNPAVIGDNCRFGSGTRLVPGIIIADGTITGAMTLLTKNTIKNSLYYGIPAKRIRSLDDNLDLGIDDGKGNKQLAIPPSDRVLNDAGKLPFCGFSIETLNKLEEAGITYELIEGGTVVKFSEPPKFEIKYQVPELSPVKVNTVGVD